MTTQSQLHKGRPEVASSYFGGISYILSSSVVPSSVLSSCSKLVRTVSNVEYLENNSTTLVDGFVYLFIVEEVKVSNTSYYCKYIHFPPIIKALRSSHINVTNPQGHFFFSQYYLLSPVLESPRALLTSMLLGTKLSACSLVSPEVFCLSTKGKTTNLSASVQSSSLTVRSCLI